jgi:hypothetical protein
MGFLQLRNLKELDPRISKILTEVKMLPFAKNGSFCKSNAAQTQETQKKRK